MASYSLSGSGVQALGSGVGALHTHFASAPANANQGHANPTNYYGVALLRVGDGTAWMPSFPLDAQDQWIALPNGTTEIGYAIFGGITITATEVFGPSPYGGGVTELAQLSDVSEANLADGQVLTYQASSGKWVNATPASSGGSQSYQASDLPSDVSIGSAGTWTDITTLALAAGTWRITGDVTYVAGSNTIFEVRLYDGSNLLSAREKYVATTNQDDYLGLNCVGVFSGSVTLHLQGNQNNSGAVTVKAATVTGNTVPSSAKATQLMAVKIA